MNRLQQATPQVETPRLALSNISWPPQASLEAYRLLQEHGISGLEIAPGLLFGSDDDPRRPSATSLTRARSDAERFGLNFVAMQSLHFGLTHAQLFGDEAARTAFVRAIEASCELARRLDIVVLTIGSAANRSFPADLPRIEASNTARECLLPVADRAARLGVTLAVEPIPSAYGTNFLNTLDDALAFVRACDHPGLRLNFDTGAMEMSGEIQTLAVRFAEASAWIGHVHLGKAHLKPVTDQDTWLATLLDLVAERPNASLCMSAEMRPEPSDDLLAARTAAGALARHARGRSTIA